MSNRIAFMLASVAGGAMIFNRFDSGPSGDMIESPNGWREPAQTNLVCTIAAARRRTRGDGLVIIDGGANIGTFAVPWSRYTAGWGHVICFEPQRWPFYALCGNLAMNNCLNAQARQEALSDKTGAIAVPFWDPMQENNFGGLELDALSGEPQMEAETSHFVPAVTIDDLTLPRLDILKLDLEGMEPRALRGAKRTIAKHLPVILVEVHKTGTGPIMAELPGGYTVIGLAQDMLCVHESEQNPELISAIGALATKLNMRAA